MKLKVYFLRGLMLLFFAVGLTSLASAQRTITGTITDAETNAPPDRGQCPGNEYFLRYRY